MLNIQGSFEYIIKIHQKVTDNHPIKIYVNKTENRITFKTKTGYYYLGLLTHEATKLFGNTKSKISNN